MILKNLINSVYIKNTIILMFDNITRIIISFIISVFIARFFGPLKFGTINYVLAVVSVLQVLVTFGFPDIALRDLGLNIQPDTTILSTIIRIRWILASIAYFLGFILFYFFLDNQLINIYLILGIELFCVIFHIYKQWFQIKSLNKYVVLSSQISFIFLTVTKVLYLCFCDNLYIYAVILVFSFFLESAMLYFFYKHVSKNSLLGRKALFDKDYAKTLIRSSFPLVLQNFAIIIYMKVDQIMIGKMLSASDVGIYSIAVTISELVYFIPMATSNAFYPKIANAKKEGADYKEIISRVGQVNTIIMLCFSLFCLVFMPFFIKLVYGEAYIAAGHIIQIHAWASIFVAVGVSNGCYLIFNGQQKLSLYATTVGAILNIILNFILIPYMGIKGAAVATLICQAISSFVFYLLLKDKSFFLLECKSLFFFDIIRRIISNRGQNEI